MARFISCDWGTSNLRLRLIDGATKTVLKEIKTSEGIGSVHQQWKNEGDQTNRFIHYILVLTKHIDSWQTTEYRLQDIPIVISGMASSTIGVIDLGYKHFPFRADGSDLYIKAIEPSAACPHAVYIVSGASTADDVMRGEETLLAGCETLQGSTELFIFPGTHSKHVFVSDGIAEMLVTYMTGEFFQLLSQQSILAHSVREPDAYSTETFFVKGVKDGLSQNLLSASFKIRVNDLFKKVEPGENFTYLSGLLIGNELKGIAEQRFVRITVVAEGVLLSKYVAALNAVRPDEKIHVVDSSAALIKAHCNIYNTINKAG